MTAEKLRQLAKLSELMLEHRLANLQRAQKAKEESEAALAVLSTPPTEVEGLAGASGAIAGLTYKLWADGQRREINQRLARQTHDWFDARGSAREAFGKRMALTTVAARLPKGRER